MLQVSEKALDHFEKRYRGIKSRILECEAEELPTCPVCGGIDTATVGVGIVGRAMHMSMATTKYFLIPNGPKPGEFYCNACKEFFDRVETE
jgi:hypothetical protein